MLKSDRRYISPEIGDVVMEIARPTTSMVVILINDNDITCVWLDENKQRQQKTFRKAELEKKKFD
jgi:hypothetical protein